MKTAGGPTITFTALALRALDDVQISKAGISAAYKHLKAYC
jgi:hypothetical protein